MKGFNRFLLALLAVLGIASVIALSFMGENYYQLSEVDRSFHEQHSALKPDGPVGHTYGVAGVLLIGVNLLYLARRHFSFMRSMGTLKTWMQIHVFAGLVGPILILFHSAFLYTNPIALIATLSLVALVLTGIIGRYIYAQVPHTVTGAEDDIQGLRGNAQDAITDLVDGAGAEYVILMEKLNDLIPASPILLRGPVRSLMMLPSQPWRNWLLRRQVNRIYREFLDESELDHSEAKPILSALRRIARLRVRLHFFFAFRGLLAWWRGLHRYFALLMIITAIIHIVVSIYMGARWLL